MSVLRVRADQIQKGDRLWGYTITGIEQINAEVYLYIAASIRQEALIRLPHDAVVEVERPEPLLQVTTTLTMAEAEAEGGCLNLQIALSKFHDARRAAVRAAKGEG